MRFPRTHPRPRSHSVRLRYVNCAANFPHWEFAGHRHFLKWSMDRYDGNGTTSSRQNE